MRFSELSPDTAHLPLSKLTPWEALQAVIPVALCFAAGLYTGNTKLGTIAASGAFTVGFAPFNAVSGSPSFSMVVTGVGIAVAAWLGSLCGSSEFLLLSGTAVIAALTGFAVAVGKHAYWVCLQIAIYFVVAAYFSLGSRYALVRGVLVLAGALLSTGAYLLRWFVAQQGSWRTLRSHLLRSWAEGRTALRHATHPRSPAVQHGIRLVITLLLATSLYKHFGLRNGYWIPMTALLVLRPDWTDTRSRGFARIAGTLLGAIVATTLAHFCSEQPAVLAALGTLFAWCCYALQAVNYAAFSCSMTAYIVFLLAFGGLSEHRAVVLRLICTIAGGALGLAVDGIWPSALQADS